ncbi:MAG: SAM-dependent methyltransferase [Ktedonobacteraceae bacterium]|nr:SAM-dependent methyltransferase [Ktedonobacteraceae bacterium]
MSEHARQTSNIEKITRRLYDRFKKAHTAFLNSIEGISDQSDREWYASLMLYRLMFLYFIQKKGCLDTKSRDRLDGDRDYLRHRLQFSRQISEHDSFDRFHTFYHSFLCKLFQEGLSKRERTPGLEHLIGRIPYLNSGLFDVHPLERKYPALHIPDAAFEHLFDFFDEFEWRLDDHLPGKANEITPDISGYIFEKCINQKQMGAYYTKVDITDYISKNTIIPALFQATERRCTTAFTSDGPVWSLLRNRPDRYIYDAMARGTALPLPPQIAAGIHDISRRKEWNRPASTEYALPAETWREVIARRQRYEETRTAITSGSITTINDLITYNLDMLKFAQDVITTCERSDLLLAFYESIERLTVLDPTCGSGAFLCAALNILKPLYRACLDRMRSMVEEYDRSGTAGMPRRFASHIERFRIILSQMARHHSQEYFILTSIITRNLYGVDIMEEAIEICKLRLFLKLVACIERQSQVEMLADIDFNVLAGNALVGFASMDELRKMVSESMTQPLLVNDMLARIEQKAQEIEEAAAHCRALQADFVQLADHRTIIMHRQQLRTKLAALRTELDSYLAARYGITYENSMPDSNNKLNGKKNIVQEGSLPSCTNDHRTHYTAWYQSHRPFHWYIEFYDIMKNGGFDVIIGNPPYLECRQVNYLLHGYQCGNSGAIHAMCIERGKSILSRHGCISMVVPLALVSTQRMKIVQNMLESHGNTWYSHYSWRPGRLFDTVNRALTIFIVTPSRQRKTFSTTYQKWASDNRDLLMYTISYTEVPRQRTMFWVPKLGHAIERTILCKMLATGNVLRDFMGESNNRVYYRTTGGLYWKIFTNFPPEFRVDGQKGHSSRETWFTLKNEKFVYPTIALLSSNVFWWWYTITTNCRDLNPSDLQQFPVCAAALSDGDLAEWGKKLLDDIQKKSSMLVRIQKQTGCTETQAFKMQKSRSIIDEIERVLARHYRFTAEELDFIINYDVKYRMGKEHR